MSATSGLIHWFRLPGDKKAPAHPGATPAVTSEDTTAEEPELLVRCRNCGHVVARPKDRIERDGAHHHTFANPHGIVYDIRCFRSADGCAASGPATFEFTWFKGYRWRIAVCRACLTHLGWRFDSATSDRFFGLIADRLIFPD
jgi:hypothetical protein